MLVYDITNEKSFENIKNWIRNIEEVFNGSKTLIYLLDIVLNIRMAQSRVLLLLNVSSLDPACIIRC